MINVDATPGAHESIDALCSTSYKLACGCTLPPAGPWDDEDRPFIKKNVGSEIECGRHGSQVITRATFKLAGWAKPDPVMAAFRRKARDSGKK